MTNWQEQLKNARFTLYTNGDQFHPAADEFWQTWQRAGTRKLYAVNAYVYHRQTLDNGNEIQGGIMFVATMYLGDDQPWFSITLNDAKSVDAALAFFVDVFVRMGCIVDPHNND